MDPSPLVRVREPRIRPGTTEDLVALLGPSADHASDANDRWQRRSRRQVLAAIGVEGCYVADVEGIGPSFMQYLFTASDNDRIQAAFPGMYPILEDREAMVEYLYITPKARNPGLAVSCVAQVVDEARTKGAGSVISFVDPTNKGAIFVSQSTGFRAFALRRSRMRWLRRTYTFEPWPTDVSATLLDLVTGRARIA